MLWLGYNNTIQFNDKLSLLSDVQVRTRDELKKWSQFALRTGISYKINNRISTAIGFTWFNNVQYVGKSALFKNEWRPWEDIIYKGQLKKVSILQRIRTEQRFLQQVENNVLTDKYEFVFRFRYRLEAQIPLGGDKWGLGVGNEIMFNPQFGNYRFFDQNRTFASISWSPTKSFTYQLMLMKIIQKKSTANMIEDQDILRLSIYHTIHHKHRATDPRPSTDRNEE